MAVLTRYRLDDLGWYQFEWLIQSLLKAALGLGVQSWGGHHDDGRDAYCTSPLRFPTEQLSDGPFLFQAKFVQNANAAGADPDTILLSAVRREASRITQRIGPFGDMKDGAPRHYVLLTNAPLSPKLREAIERLLRAAMPDTHIVSLGGGDVCDLLDDHPAIRRSFPQLLGLRDLNELIGTALQKRSRERSEAAIAAAMLVAPVFVPTKAYEKCWTVLAKYHFAVLEGPPEMGKTAIGWMIGLAQVVNGWEVIACNAPSDVYDRHDAQVPQLFIADDAFGRTEYDVTRGRQWEHDLHRILLLLNSKHWLIWTSRKHLLERALKSLDLQLPITRFPKPAEVLVDASDLSREEKALILYRHAKAAALSAKARGIIQPHAVGIVDNASFTPERIRRFIVQTLPELPPPPEGRPFASSRIHFELQQRILDSIRHPTERMRIAFDTLPLTDKWLLIALLEAEYAPTVASVQQLYENHCPPDIKRHVEELIEELRESFINQTTRQTESIVNGTFVKGSATIISWIHPSYRDLVIDALSTSAPLRHQFLRSMSAAGIKLTLSDTGGYRGERKTPFLKDDMSWNLLDQRVIEIGKTASLKEAIEIMSAMRHAHSAAVEDRKQFLADMMGRLLHDLVVRWNEERASLSVEYLREFVEASLICNTLAPLPDLLPSWERAQVLLEEGLLRGWGALDHANAEVFRNWVLLLVTIRDAEPRFYRVINFPHEVEHHELIVRIADRIAEFARRSSYSETSEEFKSEVSRVEEFLDDIDTLMTLVPVAELRETLTLARSAIQDMCRTLKRMADDADPEPEDAPVKTDRAALDVRTLFSDL